MPSRAAKVEGVPPSPGSRVSNCGRRPSPGRGGRRQPAVLTRGGCRGCGASAPLSRSRGGRGWVDGGGEDLVVGSVATPANWGLSRRRTRAWLVRRSTTRSWSASAATIAWSLIYAAGLRSSRLVATAKSGDPPGVVEPVEAAVKAGADEQAWLLLDVPGRRDTTGTPRDLLTRRGVDALHVAVVARKTWARPRGDWRRGHPRRGGEAVSALARVRRIQGVAEAFASELTSRVPASPAWGLDQTPPVVWKCLRRLLASERQGRSLERWSGAASSAGPRQLQGHAPGQALLRRQAVAHVVLEGVGRQANGPGCG